jgi:tripartite-type tricarboxylate transporter receptor subunit TctC
VVDVYQEVIAMAGLLKLFANRGFRLQGLCAGGLALSLLAGATLAQQASFPNRPVRMLTTVSAGSAVDTLGRIVGQKLSEAWKQQIVIDNRPSAGGIVASQILVDATPDGHTLMIQSIGHASNASLYSKLPYDTLRDFAGVSMVADVPNVLLVTPSLNLKSVKDLIELARSKPGQINFASAGIGSGTHMNGEQFKLATKLDIVHIPYKGTPEAINDTMSGRVQFFFSPITAAVPLVKAGKITALAVSTLNRSPVLPDVATVAESGVPGFEFNLWIGVLAPAQIPKALKESMAAEFALVLALPDVKERMQGLGAVPHALATDKFDAFIRAEVEKLAAVIKASGARAN